MSDPIAVRVASMLSRRSHRRLSGAVPVPVSHVGLPAADLSNFVAEASATIHGPPGRSRPNWILAVRLPFVGLSLPGAFPPVPSISPEFRSLLARPGVRPVAVPNRAERSRAGGVAASPAPFQGRRISLDALHSKTAPPWPTQAPKDAHSMLLILSRAKVSPRFGMRTYLLQHCGLDPTCIDGSDVTMAFKVLAEVGAAP